MPTYPRLEHLIGFAVERTSTRNDKLYISFANGGRVIVKAFTGEVPEIKALALTSIEPTGETTVLHFGTDDRPNLEVLELTNGEYMVAHPALYEGEPFDPHNLPADAGPPPFTQELQDRIEQGPDEPA